MTMKQSSLRLRRIRWKDGDRAKAAVSSAGCEDSIRAIFRAAGRRPQHPWGSLASVSTYVENRQSVWVFRYAGELRRPCRRTGGHRSTS